MGSNTDGDIQPQEGRLQRVTVGYAAKTTRAITTYEYQAPHGLNYGLAHLHDKVMEYLVPPMLEDASALLGDFVALYQGREVQERQLAYMEQ